MHNLTWPRFTGLTSPGEHALKMMQWHLLFRHFPTWSKKVNLDVGLGQSF